MRRALVVLAALILGSIWRSGSAHAEPRRSLAAGLAASGTVAVRALPHGGDGVYVDGKLVWRSRDRAARVSAPPKWEQSKNALAFVVRAPRRTVLTVVIVGGEAAGNTLEWNLPERTPARAVIWLDPNKVAVGPDELDPKLVASFRSDG